MANEKTLRDLGWRRLLTAIAEGAKSRSAVDRITSRVPASGLEQCTALMALTREALRLEQEDAPLPTRAIPDCTAHIGRLRRNAELAGDELYAIGQLLDHALELGAAVNRLDESFPELARALAVDTSLTEVARAIGTALDPDGTLKSTASTELGRARRSALDAHDALRERLNRVLSRHASAMQGQYFTEHDGRLVIPVRADAPYRIEGTVTGSSNSGSTLYLEPAEAQAEATRLKVALARVAREEARLFAELNELAYTNGDAIASAYEICIEADVLGAIAQFGMRQRAVAIAPSPELRLGLVQFRHPLLTEHSEDVVPFDVTLAASSGLVISGPNAGGKTVVLKALGLSVLMSQSGIPSPCAEQSTIGYFRDVFTDIGDDQSIERSLSTFSAHAERLATHLQAAERGTLVLLDELAASTDPEEGAALARAIVEALVERGAAVAVTTHYDSLKALGASGPGYENASLRFDFDAMQPTFEFRVGVPGASSALLVAGRHHIPEAVIERSRALLDDERRAQRALLDHLEAELTRTRMLRERAESENDEAAAERDKAAREFQRTQRDTEAEFAKRARELDRELRDARATIQRARERLAGLPAERDTLRHLDREVDRAAHVLSVGGPLHGRGDARRDPHSAPAVGNARPPLVGASVRVRSIGKAGTVLEALGKNRVRVLVGNVKLTVPMTDLETSDAATPRKAPVARARKPTTQAPRPAPMRTSLNTCNVRGERVDDAIEKVDQFLDRLLQENESHGFILHGHGTGALKSALRERLREHPNASDCHPAEPEDGGDAFTVVWLR